MQATAQPDALRACIGAWKRSGLRIAFVPTMGNLHAGHHALVALAREHGDRVVASVFVNPTQFGPGEDFASYPRTPGEDRDGLQAAGCDLLFAPDADAVYPYGPDASVRVDVPGVSGMLEGALRPGHFAGVATIVTKLLNLVQPDVAVFGQKDYQQLLVIRRLVRDLALPVAIVAAPTVREAGGLALSSRNQYLSAEERARAAVIYRTLTEMAHAVRAGTALAEVERDAQVRLEHAGLAVQYAVIRNAADLTAPLAQGGEDLIALIAARVGRTRLIDNFLITL